MKFKNFFILLFISFLLVACSKEPTTTTSSSSTNTAAKEIQQVEEVGTDLNWYAEESMTHQCKQQEGPGKMIELMDAIGKPHSQTGEKKIGDTLVQMTLEMPSEGVSVTFYRGMNRCETALKNRETAKKAVADKYK